MGRALRIRRRNPVPAARWPQPLVSSGDTAAVHAKDDDCRPRLQPAPELDRLARELTAAATEVHRWLGPGFLESVYEEALCVELRHRGVAFVRQAPISVDYKGEPVGQSRVDLLIDSRLIVELKAVDSLAPIHLAQLLSYLKAARLPLGLLINFNVPVLLRGVRRVVLTP